MYKVGDFVFAKLKGYRHWPAKITEIIANNDNNLTIYKTTFFGDLTTAKVHEGNLLSYIDNVNIHGIPQIDNIRNKTFNKALKDAEIAFKASITPGNQNTQHQQDSLLNQATQTSSALHLNDTCCIIHDESLPTKHGPMEDIQTKLQNAQDADLETSLTLAAEVGNALLSENSKLKQDLHDMALKNAELTKQIMESSNLNQIKHQDRIEELESEKDILLNKNAALVEAINKVENQLIKEKKMRDELVSIFEEQDQEKENTICNLETELSKLQKTLKKLENGNKAEQNEEIPKARTNAETQTPSTDTTYTQNNSSYLFLQLAQLKSRQDQVEHEMKTMKEHIHSYHQQKHTIPLDRNTVEVTSRRPLTPKASSSYKRQEKRRNHFSVSLQVTKNQAFKTTSATGTNTRQHNSNTVGTSQTQSKKLIQDMTIHNSFETKTTTTEKLLKNKITEGISQTQTKKLIPEVTAGISQTQTKKLIPEMTAGISQTQTKKLPPITSDTTTENSSFLEVTQKKRSRKKEVYKTKIYLNSRLTTRTI